MLTDAQRATIDELAAHHTRNGQVICTLDLDDGVDLADPDGIRTIIIGADLERLRKVHLGADGAILDEDGLADTDTGHHHMLTIYIDDAAVFSAGYTSKHARLSALVTWLARNGAEGIDEHLVTDSPDHLHGVRVLDHLDVGDTALAAMLMVRRHPIPGEARASASLIDYPGPSLAMEAMPDIGASRTINHVIDHTVGAVNDPGPLIIADSEMRRIPMELLALELRADDAASRITAEGSKAADVATRDACADMYAQRLDALVERARVAADCRLLYREHPKYLERAFANIRKQVLAAHGLAEDQVTTDYVTGDDGFGDREDQF